MERQISVGIFRPKYVDHLQRWSRIFRSKETETDLSIWIPTEISGIFGIMESNTCLRHLTVRLSLLSVTGKFPKSLSPLNLNLSRWMNLQVTWTLTMIKNRIKGDCRTQKCHNKIGLTDKIVGEIWSMRKPLRALKVLKTFPVTCRYG